MKYMISYIIMDIYPPLIMLEAISQLSNKDTIARQYKHVLICLQSFSKQYNRPKTNHLVE